MTRRLKNNLGNQYFKKKALENLKGAWGMEIVYVSIYFILAFIFEFSYSYEETLNYSIANIILGILTTVVYWGYLRHAMKYVHGERESNIGDLFYYFTKKDVIFLFGVNILVVIFTTLWSFLFIIPGIVMGIAYSQSINIKIHEKDITVMGAIKKSKRLMEGHKMEYVLLNLSFLGWNILGIITVIGVVPVIIYTTHTLMEYFKWLYENSDQHTLESCKETSKDFQ